MSVRHPKWVRVEPGTVIPAGQPYRVEFPDSFIGQFGHVSNTCKECVSDEPREIHNPENTYFIDSTWSQPLELPTEPTWGIAVWNEGSQPQLRKWHQSNGFLRSRKGANVDLKWLLDFIPLTDEQVARIEAHR